MALSLRHILLISFLFSSVATHAAIVGRATVAGASNSVFVSNTNWRVYGSFLGPGTGEANDDGTINNCKTAQAPNFVGCNLRRVTPSSVLTVTFRDDSQYEGLKPILVTTRSSADVTPKQIPTVNTPPRPANSTVTAQIRWDTLCTEAAGGRIDTDIPASALAGGTILGCVDGSGNPIKRTVQLVIGLQGGANLAVLSEVLIDLRFATPAADLGEFSPTLGADLTTSDNKYIFKTGCADFNGIDTGTSRDVPTGGSQYTGFCDYKLIPGDGKVWFASEANSPNSLSIYPEGNADAAYVGFILFLSNQNHANAVSPMNPWDATLPWLAQTNSINRFQSPGVISSGFENNDVNTASIVNDEIVYSRMATLDEAMNVNQLFSYDLIDSVCGSAPAAGSDAYYSYFLGSIFDTNIPPASPVRRCPYATIPSLVSGLLADDVNCFVATALTGSPYHYQVIALRKFRDTFLKTNFLGRAFVDFYYNEGPKAAKWLHSHPEYKPYFKVMLWPIYFIANIFNMFGALLGLVLVCTTLVLAIAVWNLQRKTFFQR